MLRSLYTAATGMDAQQTKMDVIAHNLANASTTGFKKTRAEFEDLLSETIKPAGLPQGQGGGSPSPLQVGLGVRTESTTRSFAQGDLQNTQNPLDVAIQGGGFLRVQRSNGELAYTRAGNLRVDAEGRLVTQQGELMQPPVTIPKDATAVTIQTDGTVLVTMPGKTDPTQAGTIELSVFPNPGGLESLGDNLLTETAASGAPVNVKPGEQGAGTLSQGFLETANVKAVEEMIDMITTQRAYEMNSKVIQTADQMLQRLTSLR
ncbi:MAG: flagellar basal-body rod protein FlgG [Pseudomonadota bacterium]